MLVSTVQLLYIPASWFTRHIIRKELIRGKLYGVNCHNLTVEGNLQGHILIPGFASAESHEREFK